MLDREKRSPYQTDVSDTSRGCLFACLSVCLCVCLCVCVCVCVCVGISVSVSVCLSVYRYICLCVCLSVYRYICLCVCLFVCLSYFMLSFSLSLSLSLLLSLPPPPPPQAALFFCPGFFSYVSIGEFAEEVGDKLNSFAYIHLQPPKALKQVSLNNRNEKEGEQ